MGIASHTAFIPTPGNHEYQLGGLTALDKRYIATFAMPLNGNKPTNYYIDYPNVRIISLETNNFLWDMEGSRAWLREAISTNESPFTIVMGHHGVYSVRKWRFNPEMWFGVRPILDEYDVDLMLQGHDHAYSRNGEAPDRPIYVTMSSSAKQYAVGDPEAHSFSDSGQRYYGVLRITKDTLSLNTYQESHTLLDSFQLARKR